jgi:hypothetical protein
VVRIDTSAVVDLTGSDCKERNRSQRQLEAKETEVEIPETDAENEEEVKDFQVESGNELYFRSAPESPKEQKTVPTHIRFDQTGEIEVDQAEKANQDREADKEEEEYQETEKDQLLLPIEDQLLQLCDKHEVVDFTTHINSLLKDSTIRKLGEASYSEVFLVTPPKSSSTTVLKVIPFGKEDQCEVKSILQEVRITKAMAETGIDGFIGFRG